MNAFARINMGCNKLGLDEDTRRDLYERLTGERSLRAMTPAQLEMVTAELTRQHGFNAPSTPRGRPLQGPFWKKFQALWVGGYHLGAFRDRTDAALLDFMERQTKIERPEWVRSPKHARSVIEALKARMARDAGVIWPSKDDAASNQTAIVEAQLRLLGEPARDLAGVDLVPLMKRLGTRVRKLKERQA